MNQYQKDFYSDILKIFGIALNIFLFFAFTANTQVKTVQLLLSFVFFCISGKLIFDALNFRRHINPYVYFVIILPFIFNFFFFINYTFSSNEINEKYGFTTKYTSIGNKWQWNKKGVSTTIKLHTDKYDGCFFFTTFFDYQQIANSDRITYTFADGFFGLRVLRSYKFTLENFKI